MRCIGVPVTFLVTPMSNALLPEIARLRSLFRFREAFRLIDRTLLLAGLASLAGCAIGVAVREPVIAILFQRGSFSAGSTQLVSAVFLGFAPSLIGWSLLATSFAALDRRTLAAERAAAEAQYRHGRILGLDINQRRGRMSKYAHDVAHHPFQQVDVVARLLRHHAAVELPGAVPDADAPNRPAGRLPCVASRSAACTEPKEVPQGRAYRRRLGPKGEKNGASRTGRYTVPVGSSYAVAGLFLEGAWAHLAGHEPAE
jgi:hypothetical protein